MTFEQFDSLTETILEEVKYMRDTKGKEYAGTADRFDNFNRLGGKLGIDRKLVWLVYFSKHIDSIESYIKNGKTYSTEGIRGRIVDAITYLLLLQGMVEEDYQKTSNLQNPHTLFQKEPEKVEEAICPVASSNYGQCILPWDHEGKHNFRKVWIISHPFQPHRNYGDRCVECGHLKENHRDK